MARTSWIPIKDYIILTEAEKVSLNALNLRDLEELDDLGVQKLVRTKSTKSTSSRGLWWLKSNK